MKIIAVTDDKMEHRQLLDTLLAIDSSIDAVILREKSKTDAEIILLIQQLIEAGFDTTKLIVHARAHIAAMTGITKVQLPGNSTALTTSSFGRSVHSFDEAQVAYQSGADWVLYGHLFATSSKEGVPPRGTEELFRITASLPIPVYAIGGIQPQHLPTLQLGGVAGVALMSAIFGCNHPIATLSAYKEMSCRVTTS